MPATEHTPDSPAAEASADRELCPLSFAQERLWFLDQLQPGSSAYNISQGWRLEGEFDLAAFEVALNEVVRRHETLRTTFTRVEGKPVEIISAFQPMTLQVRDLSGESDPETAASRFVIASANQPFDLQRGPLFRVELLKLSPREHLVLFTLHHIVSDAWSFEILRRELTEGYRATRAQSEVQLPELPIQYLDYAHWQREQISGETLSRDLDFWRKELAGELSRLELPTDYSPIETENSAGDSEPFELSAELTHALKALAQTEGGTLFTVLLAGLNAWLHRITGQNDFIIGSPISGRDQVETENLIGLFINTIALRNRVNGNASFRELLRNVRENTFHALAHSEVPFDEVVKALQPDRASGQNPLFQIVLALHGGYPAEWSMGNLRAKIVDVATPSAKFDWTFLLEESAKGVKGRLEYKTSLFRAESIQRFLSQFRQLLTAAAADPEMRIADLPILSAEERRWITTWNQTTTPYERDACIHELFEVQAAKTPDATALIFGQQKISYRELNERANRLAHRLQQAGITRESRVGVALERSPEMIVTLLAILKAGGAYVPLDRSYPQERLAFMIADTSVSVIVADAKFSISSPQHDFGEKLSSPSFILIDLKKENLESESSENLSKSSGADNLAYIIFTSGSTGTPKGVAAPHRSIMRLVRNTNYVSISPDDVFLQLAPISFDASTFEIWGALLNGATLAIFPSHTPSLEELGRSIQSHGVTTLWLTAGLFHQMIDLQIDSLKSVRQLLAGGDVLSVPHVQKALRELPNCQLINGYGPTENTTFTCCYRVPKNWHGKSVPIGKPISNTQVQVLDANLSPVPIGVAGELFISGDGLARGYWNRPELTDEKFLTIRNSEENFQSSTARFYRTGDLVRWLPDGNLEFLGRKDQQVKIRGFRVEPGEIEAALKSHASVRDAVVTVRNRAAQDRQLVAYVIPSDESNFNRGELQRSLQNKLPAYLQPSQIVSLSEFPLTLNGKIDLRALPDPELLTAAASESIVPPRNSAEENLARIWREVLGRNSFGVHDNFFALGGHSLLVTQMISRIAKQFQIELPVRQVFETPTIAGLAMKLTDAPLIQNANTSIPRRQTARAQARQLLNQLDQLSEAEVESFLSRLD
ncbi:MAG TPA: amino acid adenylation domain-containing protein [Verrucomicrobiae bacterium]|nr:amino acid adenylation domain-containing protein [Verrucomicrobiae bacterium]